MAGNTNFDPRFDFRSDAGGGDPDAKSPSLRRYHQLLWSKPLPSGIPFILEYDGVYLKHGSEVGSFLLSSDAALPTWSFWRRMKPLIDMIPEPDVRDFVTTSYQMGGMMLFPRNPINGMRTINVERGMNARISDRLDLTVECIRLHYLGQHDPILNPLGETLLRYSDFFELFDDFNGFVEFFLLEDILSDNRQSVNMFLPHDHFQSPSRPKNIQEYEAYRRRATNFVQARNHRMQSDVASRFDGSCQTPMKN